MVNDDCDCEMAQREAYHAGMQRTGQAGRRGRNNNLNETMDNGKDAKGDAMLREATSSWKPAAESVRAEEAKAADSAGHSTRTPLRTR